MTIHLIEPGLIARTGHYFDYGLRIARSMQARGLAVVVHAQEAAAPDVGAAFADAGVPYDATVPAGLQAAPRGPTAALDDRSWLVRPRQWLDTLAAASGEDLWVFSTLQAASLFALSTLPSTPPVVGMLHTPPRLSLWQPAAAALQHAGRACRLLAIDPLIAELTRPASAGLPVETAPIPRGRWVRRVPKRGRRP